jgi:hypothetical protein
MTTIAWDGEVLAADNAGWYGTIKMRVRKLHVVTFNRETYLAAVCGSEAFVLSALAYLRGEGEKPAPRDFEDVQTGAAFALLVDRDSRPWQLTTMFHKVPVYEPFHAMGAGREFAQGVLAVGGKAVQAIELTTEYTDFAGLGVSAMRWHNGQPVTVC